MRRVVAATAASLLCAASPCRRSNGGLPFNAADVPSSLLSHPYWDLDAGTDALDFDEAALDSLNYVPDLDRIWLQRESLQQR